MKRDIPEFKVGDRVVLRSDSADSWIDRRLQLRANKQVPGTVRTVIGTRLEIRQRSFRVDFDKIGRLPLMSEVIPAAELQRVETEFPASFPPR